MKDKYPDTKQDLYGAFVIRGIKLAHDAGLLAIVIGDTWMSIKSFEALRLRLLHGHTFDSFVHMRDVSNHPDIFGANAAFVLSMAGNRNRHAPFIRLTPLGSDRKKQDLRAALAHRTPAAGFHLASGADFAAIPGSPIVYWLSEKMRAAFSQRESLGSRFDAMNGMTTGENAKFLRLWHEVAGSRTCRHAQSAKESVDSGARWFPYNKGGEFRKWYGNQEYVINWRNDGQDVVENGRAFTRGRKYYFRPMVSWAKVSSGQPAFRYYPKGFLFDVAGTAMFGEPEQALSEAIALCNSSTSEAMLAALSPTMNFESGQIARLPLAETEELRRALINRVDKLVASSKLDWDESETSWEFERNPLVAAADRFH